MDQYVRDTTRLLIIDPSAASADQLVNVFRDAGYATRVHHVTSLDSLEQAVAKQQKWDLLIVAQLPDGLTLTVLLQRITQQDRDLPIIILADYADSAEHMAYLQQGIKAVVPPANPDMLLLFADREIDNLYTRRNYRLMSVVLNESEKQRRALLDDQVDAIVYISDATIRYANPAFYNLLNRNASDAIEGKYFKDFVSDSDRQNVETFLLNTEDSGQALAVIQCPLTRPEQDDLTIRAMITPTSFEGRFTLSLLVKPTDEAVPDAQLQQADQETGLFTKQQLIQQLDIAVQRVVAGKGTATLLHVVLQSLAAAHEQESTALSQAIQHTLEQRMRAALGVEHRGANLGNGQFLVLLAVGEEPAVQAIANTLLDNVAGEVVTATGETVPISLSMGAVILCDTGKDPKTLMVRAQQACAQAQKRTGSAVTDKLVFYRKRQVVVVQSVEKHLARMLSQALKNNTMQLYYQPIISLKGSATEHYEVQFAMVDVRGREHQAKHFSAKLNNQPFWGKVDRWQIITASKALMDKRKAGHDTQLMFQLGGCVFTDGQFLPWISAALKTSGIPAEAIILAISEADVVRHPETAPPFFNTANSLGYQAAISGFGCSVNPLATIQSLPVDFIKVDPSFTKELTRKDQDEELKAMLTTLVENGKKIIVPQVQNTKALAALWHASVDYVQGEFLQGPMTTMNYHFSSDR